MVNALNLFIIEEMNVDDKCIQCGLKEILPKVLSAGHPF